jgi:hypothetical protein
MYERRGTTRRSCRTCGTGFRPRAFADLGVPDVEICGPKATAAFASLGNVDAVIFDLRQNRGGQPEMVTFVSSYLFAKKTHLDDIYERKANKTTQAWTNPDVPGKKLAKQPVFVLTSHDTLLQ